MSLNCRYFALRSGLLVLLALSAGRARAEPPREVDNTVSYAFDEELVRGDTVSPTLEVLHVRRGGARESLIRVREHFVHELCKSVEQL